MAIDYSRWKPEQIAVARLLAEPAGRRWTNKDLALEAGVNADTISRWRDDDDFRAMVNELAERASDDYLAFVNSKLMQSIESGSVKGMELYYKKHGKLIDRKEIKGEMKVEDANSASMEDMKRQIEELERKLVGDS